MSIFSSFSFSSSSSSFSFCDDAWSVLYTGPHPRLCVASVACRTSIAITCSQYCESDVSRDHARPARTGPQPQLYEASVVCRTSTTIMGGQCNVPILNRNYVSSVWCVGPQPRLCEFSVVPRASTAKWSERRMSERMSKDMLERMSKNMSERMSKDMSERMPKDMSKRMSEDISERMSKDISKRMSENSFQSICEIKNNKMYFKRWIVCLFLPNPIY